MAIVVLCLRFLIHRPAHMKTKVAVALAAVLATLLMLPPGGGAASAPAPAATTATSLLGSNYHCTRRCGNMSIPYPFGIEPGCYHAAGFNLTCDDYHYDPPQLFLGNSGLEVLAISIENGTVRIDSPAIYASDMSPGMVVGDTWVIAPHGGPFFLSESRNNVVLVGCGVQVEVQGGDDDSLVASCVAVCPLNSSGGMVLESTTTSNRCAGVGCCLANIVVGYDSYSITLSAVSTLNGSVASNGRRGSAFFVDHAFVDIGLQGGYPPDVFPMVPATLEWVISKGTCPSTRQNRTVPECRSTHSVCLEVSNNIGNRGYRCACADGYQGNPYIVDGCQDIDECAWPDPDVYRCYGECINMVGAFRCHCHIGYKGNASIPDGCKDIDECEDPEAYSCYGVCINFPGSFQCMCPNGTYGSPVTKGQCRTTNSSTGLIVGLGVGGATSLLILTLAGPFVVRKIKIQKLKDKCFKQNNGLLLQQLISRNANISERMIITLRNIEKATNNFDRDRVIGGGGHGVVFKGILDQHVVAIKKSKIVVQREIDEFINEVVVLSQVNHRNVVKLIGCCLETEVPLLIYEFISNGTLYHHLHVQEAISLTWTDRLRIALEVARALSYLHSSASMPIFHRDIKTSNILLDDSLVAKVSDFGASRYITIDQTGVTTAIQGTIGYLDPMYYNTGRLTDKSDVFSFGVVLIELLTRKKPFLYRSENGDGIVSHFASRLIEDKLVEIIDPQVMEEEDGGFIEIATLATLCTKLNGEDRPTMREVEMTLENLLFKKKHAPCNTSSIRYGQNENSYKPSTEQNTNEASRQYTMEEEILLSATYAR